MASNLTVRPLRGDDLLAAYGSLLTAPARGFAADIDGRLVALTGVMYASPLQAFSTILDPAVKQDRRGIALMGRKMVALLDTIDAPVYAVESSTEPTSAGFLQHFGFRRFKNEVFVR